MIDPAGEEGSKGGAEHCLRRCRPRGLPKQAPASQQAPEYLHGTGVHTAAGPHGPGLVGTLLLPAARLWSCVRVPTTRLGHAVMCRNVGWLLVRTRQQTRDLLFSKSKQLESFSKLGSSC